MEIQVVGSGNFNIDSMNTSVPYEGIINENYFPIRERETNLSASLEIFKSITKNPFNKQLEYFIGLLVKSKYDGIGRNLNELDISIALDISDSMSEPIIKKPTFKQIYQNFEFFRDNNKRIEMGKKGLLKLIESMPDKMKIALTTFNSLSKIIMPLSPKSELKTISHKINSICPNGDTNLTAAFKVLQIVWRILLLNLKG